MNNYDLATEELVRALGDTLRSSGIRMGTAESCTGGLVACTLTNVSGSSEWFEGGIVAYDNRVKMKLLQVPEAVLGAHGAVSRECVEAMVLGLGNLLEVAVGLAISGIAGPGGGTAEKPVGMVWIAWKFGERIWSRCFHFAGSRLDIKEQSMRAAIAELLLQ